MEKLGEKQGDKAIEFKALTDGLGFHPFSNGLPYAPITPSGAPKATPKPSFESGSGAYSAGRPTFVTTQKVQVPRSTVQSQFPTQPQPKIQAPRVQAQTQRQLNLQANIAGQAYTLTQQQKTQAFLQVEHHYGFEYIAKRFLAYFVDSFLNMSLGAGALFLVLWKQESNLESLINPSVLIVSLLFLAFFNWAMITAQEVAFHTSAGKKFFGLQLHGTLGSILIRAILFIPSCAVFGLGVLWILFSPNGRCWHDSASGTQPQEIAEL
jgi:hypothetical protein